MHASRKIAVAISALLLVTSLVGCRAATLEKGSPEAAVQDLLELRSKLATDPAGYASFVETSMAEALAADSTSRSAGQAPMPQWKTPTATEETSSSAKVTVRWNASKDFPKWAKSTVFSLEKRGGRWIVVDASEATRSAGATATP